jgi:hypothetical protein
MLFARFLAENGLLIHPEHNVPVKLSEISELAKEEGELDPWVLAARYAARMLPAIFRSRDPVLEMRLAPEGRQRLEALLQSLSPTVFTSDDGLGWVYQFWQSENKKRVNRAGNRIGPAELPAVTQLFTEDYMVRFLLENSLGAWWVARHPDSPLAHRFAYLRLTDKGTPAAGDFGGWPGQIAEVTIIDPCCGSGHFLTVAFEMLTAMRMEEEGLSATEAGDAVITENLFGLEIDPRCTQIAAFALALAAWRSGGYRKLPTPNIACSGIGVAGHLVDWMTLAEGDEKLEYALQALHEQFRNAPELGSLIDPRRATEEGHLFSVDYPRVAPLLEQLLATEQDPETEVAGWAAAGIARAAMFLARTYTLVATNPPFLGERKQSQALTEYLRHHFPESRFDLATAFMERSINLSESRAGAVSLVTPQNWLFLQSYQHLRQRYLTNFQIRIVARLGEGGFANAAAAGAFVALNIIANLPDSATATCLLDVSDRPGVDAKDRALQDVELNRLLQEKMRSNPNSVISAGFDASKPLLASVAAAYQGIATGDSERFIRRFWEIADIGWNWELLQTTVDHSTPYGGRSLIIFWEKGKGQLHRFAAESRHTLHDAHVRGIRAWGMQGIAVSQMRSLPATLYSGDRFDSNVAAIIPTDASLLPAIWTLCSSPDFQDMVRTVDPKVNVTNATLVKVPFDVTHWQEVAAKRYPNGLPKPSSTDPTQWLFKGNLTECTDPLHAAVAHLLGYQWPEQQSDSLNDLADADGAVPIPAVIGEQPAAERLRTLLERAYGNSWSPTLLTSLLDQSNSSGKDLETWLRDAFFSAHSKLFHNRPFIWHIWDGRKDGFGVLVNYHRLDGKLLSRITHTVLGSWVELQRDQIRAKLPGAEGRLAAAEDLQHKLMLIAEGEPPYDIYIRWKTLAEQSIGWEPDLNDGVRLNIRPFVKAGVLRSKFTVSWNKDRGTDPDGSERVNDYHYSRTQKFAARERAGEE